MSIKDININPPQKEKTYSPSEFSWKVSFYSAGAIASRELILKEFFNRIDNLFRTQFDSLVV